MRHKYYLVRVIELLFLASSCFLAVQSFFYSSIYDIVLMFLREVVVELDIQVVPIAIDIDKALPLIIGMLVLLFAIYYGLLGEGGKVLDVYYLNLVLILPEVLSHSKLEWLKLADLPPLLVPKRSIISIIFTSLVIVGEYIVLLTITQFRDGARALEARGVSSEDLNEVFFNQAGVSFSLIVTTIIAVVLIANLNSILTIQIHWIASSLPYSYIVLGIIASLGVSSSLMVYLRDRISPKK